jgi:hypothetical protein
LIKVETTGRTDVESYFHMVWVDYRPSMIARPVGTYGSAKPTKLTHTPFLAFLAGESVVVVRIMETVDALLDLPDDTPVMGQRRGEWRSDFFQFTVGQLRDALRRMEGKP